MIARVFELANYHINWSDTLPLQTAETAAIVLVLGLAVLIRERGSLVSRLFFSMALATGFWLSSFSLMFCASNYGVALLWAKVGYLGAPFIPAAMYNLVVAMIPLKGLLKKLAHAAWLVSAVFAGIALTTGLLIHNIHHYSWGYYPQYGSLGNLYIAFFISLFAASFQLFRTAYQRVPSGSKKQRARHLLIAFAACFPAFIDFLPKYGVPVYPFGYLSVLAFAAIAARGIWRYRLVELSPSFLDSISDAVIVADENGQLILFNPASERILGTNPGDIPLKEWAGRYGFYLPDQKTPCPPERLPLVQALEQEPVDQQDLFVKRDDLTEGIWLNVSAWLLKGGAGDLRAVVGVFRDVTARRQAEEVLQKNKRLRELATLKDQFLASVSHELRSPLTAIKASLGLIKGGELGPVNEKQRRFLGTADESIDRLAELINNLLDLSQIEAGRFKIRRQRVSVQYLIESTIANYKALLGPRTLTHHLNHHNLDVFADPGRILQVLGNLISNAVKFTDEKGALHLETEQKDGFIAITVQDNGRGITPEDLPKLFQKFSQIQREGIRPRGTGLGLALSKELIELHKGSFKVNSELNHGSRFTFSLPVYVSEFVLNETLRELVAFKPKASIGLIIVDRQTSTIPLEEMIQIARKNLRSDDVVLDIDLKWIVIFAITDSPGLNVIVSRLKQCLENVQIGTALYPQDGSTALQVFTRATQNFVELPGQTRSPSRGIETKTPLLEAPRQNPNPSQEALE